MAERFLNELTDFSKRAGIDSLINTPMVNLSHYRILRKIGQGGMSIVYEALDERLGRKVAIKVLHPFLREKKEYCERFFLEAKTVAQLHHPNIVQIFDVASPKHENSELYIVCELVEGLTLCDYVAKNPAIFEVPELSAMIIYQVAQALYHAHKNDVIHRDIKEENIMVTFEGQIKLLDFGIAKLKGSEGLTHESALVGSLSNMAPEVIRGEKASNLSDIFSLSLVFYFLLTLKKPFNEDSPQSLLGAILNKHPLPIQKISPFVVDDLANICEIGLNKQPHKRFLDANLMSLAIEGVLKDMDLLIDINKMASVLKNPKKEMESFKREILLKVSKRVRHYEQEGQDIKALSLKYRLDHKPQFKKSKIKLTKKKGLLAFLLLIPICLMFIPFSNIEENRIETPLKEEIITKNIEEAPTVDLAKPFLREKSKIESLVNITIWPFASIYVDNKQIMKNAKYASLKLPLGEHILRFEHPYAENIEKALHITDTKPLLLNIVLEKTKPAKLVIKSNIDADVFIDNVYKGNTYDSLKRPIIIALPNKTSHIKKDVLIAKPNFKPFYANIELVAGETKKIEVVLNYLSKK